ncbi:MAG: hypothetical protein KBG15_11630 [Kofleriaceae bacterium]|nr:hypothetical protein [Kofleriaceae bacterium]
MNEWLKCSACKRGIGFSTMHWVCSVSTCNRNRTRLVFCSVSCWDSHVAVLRHREAWAVEATAPTHAAWQAELAAATPMATPDSPTGAPVRAAPPSTLVAATPTASAAPATHQEIRRQVVSPSATPAGTNNPVLSASFDREVLIVVSKMKKYIRDRSGMNCSDGVADMLSEHVRALCDDAIRVAAQDGRKTVLDRDVVRPRPR